MSRLAKPDRDVLSEFLRYRDTGCDLARSCLTCPLSRCRYDEPLGYKHTLALVRDEEIRRLRRQGISVDALAARYDLSRRTVFRILKKGTNHERPDPAPAASSHGPGTAACLSRESGVLPGVPVDGETASPRATPHLQLRQSLHR